MRVTFLGFLLLQSCIIYHVRSPSARYVKPEANADSVHLMVQIRQHESPEFRRTRNSLLAKEARDYNFLILSRLKRTIEMQPGVIVDETARVKVTLETTLPESSQNHGLVGLAGCLTLFVFPVWNSYEYPIAVIVTEDDREVYREQYTYGTTQVVGWLMPVGNLLVSTWHPDVYATLDSRNADTEYQFGWFYRNVAGDVIQSVRRLPPQDGFFEL